MKFRYTIWLYRGADFQSNNIEKHPSHKYLFFLTLLELRFTFNKANNHSFVLIIAKKFTKNSQNSLTLFLNITPWYRKIKILSL